MLGTEIELLISDFDGTLVDTFSANYMAYQKAFAEQGLCLSESQYRACFGFRFDEFMKEVGVVDVNISSRIRELKSVYYPFFFDYLNVNKPLLHFIEMFHVAGGKTAIASTARKKNLINALAHIGVLDTFDYVLAGEDVDKGKPSPEIYQNILRHFECHPSEAVVFEDSEVGVNAAIDAGINYILIKKEFYGD